ncbi:MAG: catalase HPII, partial [Dongiaceae bacterium]
NIDEGLANAVATGLRLKKMPEPAEAAMPTRQDLKKSPKLSILLNGPESFEGRKVGVLVTDGVDIALVNALKAALEAEGAAIEIVAPSVGGVKASDGTWLDAKQKIDGGPSVLYDAVAVLPSAKGVAALAGDPAAKQFVADAFVHCKFIGFSPEAGALFDAAGVKTDEGFVKLSAGAAKNFVKTCRQLRYWDREATIKWA